MSYTPELVAELEILVLFPLDSTKEGLKVHQTAARRCGAAGSTTARPASIVRTPSGAGAATAPGNGGPGRDGSSVSVSAAYGRTSPQPVVSVRADCRGRSALASSR